jgi:hypothetical protein
MTVNYFQQPGFFQFLAAIDSDLASRASRARMQGCSFCGGSLHSACYPRNHEGQGNWRRLQQQRGTVSVVTNADVEQLQNLCAFSGDVSILGL